MSTFVNRTFASGNDMALQLGGEEWVRTLAIGNAWSTIRIGTLMAINPIGTNNLPTNFSPKIGMCSGNVSTYGAASTANFVGIDFAYVGNGAYTVGSGNPYWAFNGNNYVITKVGTTITPVALGGGWNIGWPTVGVGVARRWLNIIDITKGSPNYTVGVWDALSTGSLPTPSADFTVTDLLTAMGTGGAIISEGITFGHHTAVIAASEASGGLDTVNIYSNLPGYPLEIYAVAVQKLA